MIKKSFLKTKCKVTFEAPQGITDGAETVYLVGDFNEWNETSHPMEKKKGGRFTLVVDLPLNREFQYRFLVDGNAWHNDWEAEKYVPNPFSGDNSVVTTYPPTE
ncbi:MAG: glycoside hydrolase [Chloroflexi bacterium CFX4]|nr:glycoside hydrolase [Chloroflexi bacterium CFX4]MDL1921063.1 glycoside hydrolase [Chloroflexi bacterium CFX3]